MSFVIPSATLNRGVKRVAPGATPCQPTTKKVKKEASRGQNDFEKMSQDDLNDTKELHVLMMLLNSDEREKKLPQAEKAAHMQKMFECVERIIDRNHNQLITKNCRTDARDLYESTHQLMFKALSLLNERMPLHKDFIRWAISKFLLSMTGRIVYDQLGALLFSWLLQLLQLQKSDREETAAVMRAMIEQMHRLTGSSPARSIDLTDPTAEDKYRVEIPLVLKNGCETVIMATIIDLLNQHQFDFPSLPVQMQFKLWECVFRLAKSRSQDGQHLSTRLMHRLLVNELANYHIVQVVVEIGVALMKMYPPSRIENEKTTMMRDSVVMIVQHLTEHLRKLRKSKLFDKITPGALIWMASTILALAHEWREEGVGEERRAVMVGQRNALRSFSALCCRHLSAIRLASLEEEMKGRMRKRVEELVERVKVLISLSLCEWAISAPSPLRPGTTHAAVAAAAEEKMACAAGFLLFVDELNGNEENSIWISNETDATLRKCGDRVEAALRARHLVISSLARSERTEERAGADSPAASTQSQQQQGKAAATAAASSTGRTTAAAALLQRLLLDERQMVEVIASVEGMEESRATAVLQALFSIAAQMIPLSQTSTASAVAVLSLPWMATDADILSSIKRHHRSLPFLKDLYKLKGVVRSVCESSPLLRSSTLAPLASLPRPPCYSEWRRAIYEKALTLRPSRGNPSAVSLSIVSSALDSLAPFVSSVEANAYERTLSMVMELVEMDDLERSPVHIESITGAISASLCAIDGVSRRRVEGSGEWSCVACDRLQREGVASPRVVPLPGEFGRMMVKVFTDESIKGNTIENRIVAYSILFALLCHVQDAVKKYEEVIIASLCLITDKDVEVRKDYEYTFKVMLSMKPSERLREEIKRAFMAQEMDLEADIEREEDWEEARERYEISAPFLMHCASANDNESFQVWARQLLYQRAFFFCESPILTRLARELHMGEARKDVKIGGDPKKFFARQLRAISKMMASQLWTVAGELRMEMEEEEGAEWNETMDHHLDLILDTAVSIFGFESKQGLLHHSGSHIVAECFVVDESRHEDAIRVIERIRVHLDRDREGMLEDSMPAIVEKILFARRSSTAITSTMARKLGTSFSALLKTRRFNCTLFMLRIMAVNKAKALSSLYNINRAILNRTDEQYEEAITDILNYGCQYLGYLFSFRRSLVEDETYEIRETILASITVLVGLLDRQFLDEIASKLMPVLRATTEVGECAVEVWTAFVQRLGNDKLVSLLPQILIAVQPLLKYESSSLLLKTVFEQREALKDGQSESFERAVMILLGGDGATNDDDGSRRIRKYLNTHRMQPATAEDIILGCARMLHDEGKTVGRVVLQRLEATLDGRPLRDDVAAAIMTALLHTIRVCGDGDVKLSAAKCIGMIGALDPGRLGLSQEGTRKGEEKEGGKRILFVNSRNHEFHIDLLIRCWNLYTAIEDADTIDIASYAIQCLLDRLVGKNDDNGIFARLPEECKKDIGPFRRTSLTNNNDIKANDTNGQPIFECVPSFAEWLQQNLLLGIVEIRNQELMQIFMALRWLIIKGDPSFSRYLLPHLIIIMLMERKESMIEHFAREMIGVLRKTIDNTSSSWIRLAAHVVFSIVDILERYAINKSEGSKKDSDYDRVVALITRVCGEKLPDGSLLVVVAAEKCQCPLRALRWCEQFAIGGDVTGFGLKPSKEGEFDRGPFYTMQRLYMQLNEVDGVAGAFETIARNATTTPDERILAFEAKGDYTEALPLYTQSGEQKDLKLLECLLRLNQPRLALSTAVDMLGGRDPSSDHSIEGAQLEAAWHLRDWGRLDEMLKKSDPLSNGDSGWGAACASIMNTIEKRKEDEITLKTDRARWNVVERLTALTIEDNTDTYAQSYKYIAQLHMLAEIDDAKIQLLNDSGYVLHRDQMDNIMKHWDERSDSVVQCASTMEPMLRVRRELLRVAGGDRQETRDGVTRLLLQSCRLARQAGHLQIAWTFLVEAKALNACHQAVGMEEARFEFQKGNQSEAIGMLTRLLNVQFGKIHEMFTHVTKMGSNKNDPMVSQMNDIPRAEKAAYAEVQILRTEYELKAGASSPQDLYATYIALKKLDVPSEDLHYRIAVFCDSLLNMSEQHIKPELISNILSSYAQVLKFGRSHLFHAVPRMLTIWLDITQKFAEELRGMDQKSSQAERRNGEIRNLNSTMRQSFDLLPLSVFFPSFPQLLSRILHPDKSVFEELTLILGRLLSSFPHQALWQAIAVYRDTPEPTTEKQREEMRRMKGIDPASKEKMEKCRRVFERARTMDKTGTLGDLIDQYDFLARQFISIAENDAVRDDKERLISKHFRHLHNFFNLRKMDTALLHEAKSRNIAGVRTVTPKIMMPMTEMLEQSVTEKEEDVRLSTFSQINMDDFSSPLSSSRDTPIVKEVWIENICDVFVVMSSLMAPRKITLRGSDGKLYGLLCKKDDELRKDARLMSFCKMMNCLMRRTPEARRRQLMVRTFTPIPLQAKGGVLEWVPNLKTFKETLNPLFKEYQDVSSGIHHFKDNWSAEKKLHMMRTHFYKVYPLVAAEWQRRAFSDPCSWHKARLLFTRSCAVMSMIGFVLGLGDRHAENILVDQTDGGILHVDFNILFNKGESLNVPEIVPFRLTRNLVDGFGPTGAEGTWRKSAETTLEVMRSNSETLLTVMQAFIYDPLIEFSDSRAQQNKGQKKSEEKKKENEGGRMGEILMMIKNRLEGHIVTPKTLMKHSLTKKMSVSGQVAKLHELATDEVLLSQMFSGWCPFV